MKENFVFKKSFKSHIINITLMNIIIKNFV